jgi:hypothetical protein
VDISAETLQGLLDKAWLAAPAAANTLRDQLVTFEQSALNLLSGGSLSSVSKNSASQAYAAGTYALTTLQLQQAWRRLVNLFDKCKSEVDSEISASDPQAPANDQDPVIYARMMLSIQAVTEYEADVTDLLLPPTLAPAAPFSM